MLCALLFCFTGAAQQRDHVPGRVLVKTRTALPERELNRRLGFHGGRPQTSFRQHRLHVVEVADAQIETALASLRADPEIEFAEPDYLATATQIPNDPFVTDGSEWHLAKIQAPQAWDITLGNTNVIIAVLDSGVNAAHPDLAGRLLPGYDFVWNDADPADDYGHGTAVAGTIVADGNNSLGVAGVAFGCLVLPVKVMDAGGSASHSAIAQGIEYAVDHGARIINLSMGGDFPSSTLQDAINYAWSSNVLVVASAGNTGGTAPQYPAACDHVVAVAASDATDARVWFSTFGSFVTLYAPGVTVWTTQRDLNNPYAGWSGTSFSSPVVAGVAALMLSVNPALSNSQLVDLLKQTADDLGPEGFDSTYSFGRVNAWRAVNAANPDGSIIPPLPPLPDPPLPIVTNEPPPLDIHAPVVVLTKGLGTVTPNLNGAVLEIGKTYQLKAVPARGQVFAGWEGIDSKAALITFTMRSNLTLVANFVPSPFPAVRGNYAGLVANEPAVTPQNSGYFAITVTASGQFTGKLLLAGGRQSLRGQFDLNGEATVSVRRNLQTPLAMKLRLDLSNATDVVAGSVSDGQWTSGLTGDRNVFNQYNPARQAGDHAFVLARAEDNARAATGSSRINLNGATRVRGTLADGRVFATASALARNGDCPFYLSLNRGNEVVIGWLNFPTGQSPAATGTVLWVRSGTNSFAATLQATGL